MQTTAGALLRTAARQAAQPQLAAWNSASSTALITSSRNAALRSSIEHQRRYAAIHAFFSRSARQDVHAVSRRSFHSSRQHFDSSDKPGGASTSSSSTQPSSADKVPTPSSSGSSSSNVGKKSIAAPTSSAQHSAKNYAGAFRNWPASLRELALKAVRSGTFSQSPASTSSTSPSPPNPTQSSPHPPDHPHHVIWARPTQEDLLRLARGFWQRTRIRFKWFTIRSFRRFNADDFSAFFTLGGLSTILLLVLGTTTFVSVVVWGLNALSFDQWIARKIADYLTAETGVVVVFESAIVPKWKDSKISFKNVYLTKRPQPKQATPQSKYERAKRLLKTRYSRGTASTAGQGMAWEGTHHDDEEISQHGVIAPINGDDRKVFEEEDDELADVDTNFTMFDLNVDSIDISLSVSRWWDGKGLVTSAAIKGVRGVVDRRNVHWDPEKPYDPKAHRRKPRIGDFQLDSLVLEDFLVTVYQPSPPGSPPGATPFRPFNFSIFRAQIPRFRRQWLFYDLLNAEYITGQIDGCLFSLHKPQTIGRSIEREWERTNGEDREGRPSPWRTISRFRIDGVNIDHVKSQTGLTGPISWITSGKFDFVADMRFPQEDSDSLDLQVIFAELVDNLSAVVSGGSPLDRAAAAAQDPHRAIPGQSRLSGPAIELPESGSAQAATEVGLHQAGVPSAEDAQHLLEVAERGAEEGLHITRLASKRRGERTSTADPRADAEEQEQELRAELAKHFQGPPLPPSVVIDVDVRFKDIKAAVPLFAKDLSYRDNAFVRPIVAFMNANRTLIPIRCRIVMDLTEFDGSFDLAQTGMLPIMSAKVHEALAHHVASQNANQQRLRNVSLWSLQMTAHAALTLVKNVRDSFARSTPAYASTGGPTGGNGAALKDPDTAAGSTLLTPS
ncbi:Mitochondrial distribution and morphology protein 31, mitochondrial precursor [Tilletia horrida]|uniref:Mitochondrial distribution and morphology protein 31, mitochondrial n=1 Tax=Tilletia horrida TaxID=155126 RepID=A0AAN6JSE2_9BASI|nr:Mitochondrial distribution and morphology protein 31, mitochondrial precursor [Tilletia horrida]